MPKPAGSPLQVAAERIVARYLSRGTTSDVQIVSSFNVHADRGIDVIVGSPSGERRSIKVKADPYFGTDEGKVQDRSLSFYRADTGAFAFEALANAATKEPGWMFESEADDLYYYFVALAQDAGEIGALCLEPDDVFFSEIQVERDELVVLPMRETRRWFEEHADEYPPRPIFVGGTSAWYRLVPRSVVQQQIVSARILGGVFGDVAL